MKKGFSVIESLVVVVIIGIFGAMVLVSLNNIRTPTLLEEKSAECERAGGEWSVWTNLKETGEGGARRVVWIECKVPTKTFFKANV